MKTQFIEGEIIRVERDYESSMQVNDYITIKGEP